MVSHAEDLRAEVPEGPDKEALLSAIAKDHTTAPLSECDRGMLDFAVRLTLNPARMTRDDVERLRSLGFDDYAINDIVQVTGLFNYYNRLADGLGIDSEPRGNIS